MTAADARPGDRAALVILAMQDELTALGLLPPGDGTGPRPRLGRRVIRIGTATAGPGSFCGTDYGYHQHLKAATTVCPGCRQAHTEAGQQYRAARRAS